jgi:gluconate 2-dehydrogenase alpha chain
MFNMRSHLTERHGAAKLPENLAVQDWGVTYDDLESHYWRAEQMMGVSGKAGNVNGKIIDGGNPFEGVRKNEYPLPALKKSQLSVLFEEGARKLGYHPHPAPAANLSETYKNPDGITRPGCAYCGYCERFGCMIGAKSQPSNTLLPVLLRRKKFELRTGCWVRRIVHKDGKATGVQYIDAQGRETFQPASIVVLSTFTLNNVRLLYLSKIGTPYDAAAGKGTLGKNLTHQVEGNTRVFFEKPLNAFMGTGGLAMRISDFDGDHGLNGSEGLLRMGMIGVLSNGSRPIGTFDAVPKGSAKTNWGSEWKAAALKWRDRNATIALSGEHLSYRQNFMDLDPTYTDKFGDPLLRFTLDWTDHEHRQSEFAKEIAQKIAPEMGAVLAEPLGGRARYNVVNYQSTHIQGGTAMGLSPESSVVNRYQQHWDMQNLWVLGASCIPQNASHNPTLTILATTTWAADALIDRYLKHPGSVA